MTLSGIEFIPLQGDRALRRSLKEALARLPVRSSKQLSAFDSDNTRTGEHKLHCGRFDPLTFID
jgi:hypothetical protein